MSKKKFTVWCPDCDEAEKDGGIFSAQDMQEAVELWAENDDIDSAEYRIVSGEEVKVLVRDMETGVISSFSVCGESCAVYYATELKDE